MHTLTSHSYLHILIESQDKENHSKFCSTSVANVNAIPLLPRNWLTYCSGSSNSNNNNNTNKNNNSSSSNSSNSSNSSDSNDNMQVVEIKSIETDRIIRVQSNIVTEITLTKTKTKTKSITNNLLEVFQLVLALVTKELGCSSDFLSEKGSTFLFITYNYIDTI